jgi:hypothetical protein
METNMPAKQDNLISELTSAPAIMSPQERRQLLSRIARGEITVLKPVVINKSIQQTESQPDYTDLTNAIAELNKMDGIHNLQQPMQRERVHIIRPRE